MVGLGDPSREVLCGVCQRPGYLDSQNEVGFLIRHPGRLSCRAPLNPPDPGEIAVPVKIGVN